jgi:hypothetical protein
VQRCVVDRLPSCLTSSIRVAIKHRKGLFGYRRVEDMFGGSACGSSHSSMARSAICSCSAISPTAAARTNNKGEINRAAVTQSCRPQHRHCSDASDAVDRLLPLAASATFSQRELAHMKNGKRRSWTTADVRTLKSLARKIARFYPALLVFDASLDFVNFCLHTSRRTPTTILPWALRL